MAPEDLARFTRFVCMDPKQNRARFYTLSWDRSLFDELASVRTYHRLGRVGRTLATAYPNRQSAEREILRLFKLRLRLGYTVSDCV
jgi:predicted DNA-binding WGR domain protein